MVDDDSTILIKKTNYCPSPINNTHPSFFKKRAGEYKVPEVEKVIKVIRNPAEHNIPHWFLNRRRDIDDGTNYQIISNLFESKLRDDLERLKKIRAHRGLRHMWGLKVRGQRTGTTGRGRRKGPVVSHKKKED